jgi:aryl-alcohol dehydrogenase-like predicted oxidoreductase
MIYNRPWPEITPFTFGTTGVYDAANPQHVKVVRAAMDAGVWFHTSPSYGEGEKRTYDVLRKAFGEAPSQRPKCIVKVDPHTPKTIRGGVEGVIAATGIERVDIAQILTYMQPHSQKDLQPGCAIHDMMCALQDEGKVGNYVLELNTEITDDIMDIVRQGMYDGYIFYYNVVQRCVRNNPLYDLLKQGGAPLLSLRTMGGGPRDLGGSSSEQKEATRRTLAALVERAGCADEAEFRMRFPLSNPQMVTTIGSTCNVAHLHTLIENAHPRRKLPHEVFDELEALHRIWFER